MDRRKLEEMVARGEGTQLEFKKRTPEPRRLAKEVVALANSSGGVILLGVDDNGAILGVKDSTEEEYAVQAALEMWCVPAVRWYLRRVPVSRKREALVLTVPSSKIGPHYVRSSVADESGTAYVRLNDESIEASPEALLLLIEETEARDVVFEFGDLEIELMRYLEALGSVTSDYFAKQVGIVRDRAIRILVTLTRARILRHHVAKQGDFFTLVDENLG
jgi:predicted HTH transcriptional regulator